MEGKSMINLAMRGLQFLWALLVMALIGNMIAEAYGGNPAIVNYAMFCAVFAMLSLLYLVPASFMDSLAFHPAIPLALDALNALFWFCAAVALAAYLHVHSCGNQGYINSNFITNGSANKGKRCHEAQAACAFLFFGWIAFTASAVLGGLGMGGGPRGGGVRRGPAMSQV